MFNPADLYQFKYTVRSSFGNMVSVQCMLGNGRCRCQGPLPQELVLFPFPRVTLKQKAVVAEVEVHQLARF